MKQCKKTTKKGQQCRNRSLPGAEFCCIHWPRESWLPLIIGAIIGWASGYFTSDYFYKKSLKDNYICFQRYVPPVIRGFPIVIADGTNPQVIRRQGDSSSMFSDSPFKFWVDKDGKIEIYGDIRNPDGMLIAGVYKDHIGIIPGSSIDINSDSKAIEIVDDTENPIFQLSVIPYKGVQFDKEEMFSGAKEVVQFYYVCYVDEKKAWWCVTPEGSQRVYNRTSMQEWQRKIPRLFKYPGHKYSGKRLEDPNR